MENKLEKLEEKFKEEFEVIKNCDKNNTQIFSLDGFNTIAKCVDVYDGDTITVAICLFGKCFLFKVRLAGINTPEIRNKNLEEKKMGLDARDYVKSKILQKIINIKCGEFDKYGRLLGVVYIDGMSLNDDLIEKGYAVPYMV